MSGAYDSDQKMTTTGSSYRIGRWSRQPGGSTFNYGRDRLMPDNNQQIRISGFTQVILFASLIVVLLFTAFTGAFGLYRFGDDWHFVSCGRDAWTNGTVLQLPYTEEDDAKTILRISRERAHSSRFQVPSSFTLAYRAGFSIDGRTPARAAKCTTVSMCTGSALRTPSSLISPSTNSNPTCARAEATFCSLTCRG